MSSLFQVDQPVNDLLRLLSGSVGSFGSGVQENGLHASSIGCGHDPCDLDLDSLQWLGCWNCVRLGLFMFTYIQVSSSLKGALCGTARISRFQLEKC